MKSCGKPWWWPQCYYFYMCPGYLTSARLVSIPVECLNSELSLWQELWEVIFGQCQGPCYRLKRESVSVWGKGKKPIERSETSMQVPSKSPVLHVREAQRHSHSASWQWSTTTLAMDSSPVSIHLRLKRAKDRIYREFLVLYLNSQFFNRKLPQWYY